MGNSTRAKLKSSRLKDIARWGVPGVIVAWAGSAAGIMWFFPASEKHGPFGDMFGAINALFSGLAFLGVVVAILLQGEELALQRKEIEASRQAQQETAKALTRQLELSRSRAEVESIIIAIEACKRLLDDSDAKPTVSARQRSRKYRAQLVDHENRLIKTIDKHSRGTDGS